MAQTAVAHAAVSTRNPRLYRAAAIGAVLGVFATFGIAVAPAAAQPRTDAITALVSADVVTESTSGAVRTAAPLSMIELDATAALVAGQQAVAAAATLATEIADFGLSLDVDAASVDTALLGDDLVALSALDAIPPLLRPVLTQRAVEHTAEVVALAEALDASFTAAKEKKAAEEAAARALAEANTVSGAKATARQMAASQYGWGDGQFSCLVSLWNKESGWNYRAYNSSSGATGIPQSLPGSKMATAGADWRTSAATQIAWGLNYIQRAYGSPCSAWSHSQATNWY